MTQSTSLPKNCTRCGARTRFFAYNMEKVILVCGKDDCYWPLDEYGDKLDQLCLPANDPRVDSIFSRHDKNEEPPPETSDEMNHLEATLLGPSPTCSPASAGQPSRQVSAASNVPPAFELPAPAPMMPPPPVPARSNSSSQPSCVAETPSRSHSIHSDDAESTESSSQPRLAQPPPQPQQPPPPQPPPPPWQQPPPSYRSLSAAAPHPPLQPLDPPPPSPSRAPVYRSVSKPARPSSSSLADLMGAGKKRKT